jgi:REP element-mobilizing transposase RayT
MATYHNRRSIRLKGYDYSKAGLYFITICTHERKPWFGEIEKDEMVLNEYGQIAFDQWIKLPERYPHMELDAFQIMPNHMHGILWIKHLPVGAGLAPAHDPNDAPAHDIAPNNVVGAGLAPAHDPNDTPGPRGDGRPQGQGRPQGVPQQPGRNPDIDYGYLCDDGDTYGFDGHARDPDDPGQPNEWIIRDGGDNDSATAKGAPTVGMMIGAYKSLVANGCLTIFKSKSEPMGKIWQRNYYEHIIRNEQSYWYIAEYIRNNPANWKTDTFNSK